MTAPLTPTQPTIKPATQPAIRPNRDPAASVAIIGAGPAGLMAAETLANLGWSVDIYDGMPSVGRKFLLAGVGGMNITHAEPAGPFLSRYRQQQSFVAPWLQAFGPEALRQWVHDLGIETFVGSSGRVFPQAMKAAPLLRAWLLRLRRAGVRIHSRHRWLGWDQQGALLLQAQSRGAAEQHTLTIRPRALVLALGGASWSRLGSDGAWVPLLGQRNVAIAPLKPANCGFEVQWSEHFRSRFAGQPLKSIRLRHLHSQVDGAADSQVDGPADGGDKGQLGECMVTATGLEGGIIYTLSAALRDSLEQQGTARITLDLLPDRSLTQLTQALGKPRGSQSMASHLRRQVRLHGVKASLLREVATPADWLEPARLAGLIKALPLTLTATRPLDEAISSAGGVAAAALDQGLMLKSLPGVFCAGEMLDWEAPTGGYLLTVCFASGRAAGQGVHHWLSANPSAEA